MKSSTQKPDDITTMQEAVVYLRGHLAHRGHAPDENIAAALLGLNINDNFEDWYKADEDFAAIIDAAGDLEWSNGSPEGLVQEWAEIERRVARLGQRYASLKENS